MKLTLCLHGRLEAKRLGRMIVKSLAIDTWTVGYSRASGRARLERGEISVELKARRFRMFDRVRVSIAKNDIWLPLLIRCRVRSAARRYLAIMATVQMEQGDDNG